MDPQKFLNSLKGAQRLMNDDGFNARVNNLSKNVDENSYLTEQELVDRHNKRRYDEGSDPMSYRGKTMDQINTNLPPDILQAMLDNPIDMGKAPGLSSSILDNINGIEELERSTPVPRRATQRINESSSQVVSSPVGIDYNYIKYLIEDSMKKLKEEILSESSLGAIKIGKGGKIALVDQKGNLYEANLKLLKKAQVNG